MTGLGHRPPLRNLFWYLTTLSAKKMLPNVQSEHPLVQLWTIPCVLSLDTREKSSAPLSPLPLLRKLRRAAEGQTNAMDTFSLITIVLEKNNVLGGPNV